MGTHRADVHSEARGRDVSLFTAVPAGHGDGDALPVVVADLPQPPQITTYAEGGHTRIFWNDHTLDAFAFLAGHLTP